VPRRSPDDLAAPRGSRVRRSAVLFCLSAVGALVAAVVVFAVSGPPYAQVVAGGVLYALGLLAGLIGAVLLWLAWSELREDVPPGRLRWGVSTATAALLLVCACAVVTLSKVAGGTAQLWLIGATALMLLLALVALAGAAAAPEA
jgi:peptidoglycan/LPS O-acetylase OafA/YrhL